MAVIKNQKFEVNSSVDATFSTVPTNHHLKSPLAMSQLEWKLQRYPQIHCAHHNNKPYSVLVLGKDTVVLIMNFCELLTAADEEVFPTYFHSIGTRSRLYKLLKSE
jgi:hypothetical protein